MSRGRGTGKKLQRHRESRSRRALFLSLIGGGLLAPFVIYVVGRLDIVQTGYDVDALEDRARELEETNRALRLRRSRLEALPRVEQEARRLGLEPLPLQRLVVIRDRDEDTYRAPPPPPLAVARDGR